jgi:GTP-binding protein HflX
VTAETTQIFELWNKLDLLNEDALMSRATQAGRQEGVFITSALTGAGVEALLDAVDAQLAQEMQEAELTLSFAEGRARAWLHDQGVVVDERQTEDGFALSLRWTPKQAAQFAKERA